jgi:hypothetical protein
MRSKSTNTFLVRQHRFETEFVSIETAPEIELNKALQVLRKKLKRELSDASPEQFDLEFLSAILLTISLKQLRTAGVLTNWAAHRRHEPRDEYAMLFQCLEEFASSTVSSGLLCPSSAFVQRAIALLADSKLQSLQTNPFAIGSVYQLFCMVYRSAALEKIQVGNKSLAPETLIAFTQVYTPTWVTDFLLANTLLPADDAPACRSGLPENRFNGWRIKDLPLLSVPLTEVRLIDPACGAGHFLLSAYDLFKTLYAERGAPSEEAITNIFAKHLHGADIDELGLSICALALLTKKMIDAPDLKISLTNICSARSSSNNGQNSTLGSISSAWKRVPDHPLANQYDIVVTNPPYIGRRLISRELKQALAKEYPLSRHDLAAAFLEGSLALVRGAGRLGMITQSSLLSLPSYDALRRSLCTKLSYLKTVNCGPGVFPLLSGEKANSVLLIMEKGLQIGESRIKSANLIASPHGSGMEQPLTLGARARHSETLLALVASENEQSTTSFATTAVRAKSVDLAIFARLEKASKLQSVASVKQGLATTNNARFVRYFWDVEPESIGTTWVPYAKGAGSERWHTPNHQVVKWGNNGREIKEAVNAAYPYLRGKTAWVVKNEQFYFRPGLCFSFINKRKLAVRRLPAGCIFDVASSAIFSEGVNEDFLLGYLNSDLISALIRRANPTINIQVGNVKMIPFLHGSVAQTEQIAQLARQCFAIKQRLVNGLENLLARLNQENNTQAKGCLREIWQRKKNEHDQLTSQLLSLEDSLNDHVLVLAKEVLGLDRQDAGCLRGWLDRLKEGNLEGKRFFTEQQFASKLANDLVGALLRKYDSAHEEIVLIKQDSEPDYSKTLAENFARLYGTATQDAEHFLKSILSKPVNDFSRTLGGPPRYVTIRLRHSAALVLLSRRALSRYVGLSRIDKNHFWQQRIKDPDMLSISTIIKHTTSQFQLENAISEFDEALAKFFVCLDQKVDWTTKDLIDELASSI